MSREITSEQDCTPAFIGIIQRFLSLMADEPVLGLWPKLPGRSMAWRQQPPDAVLSALPSWS